jgi:hypothetical protein
LPLHAVYAVLLRIRQVRAAPTLLVVVVTEVEVDEDTKKNLGCLKKKININTKFTLVHALFWTIVRIL